MKWMTVFVNVLLVDCPDGNCLNGFDNRVQIKIADNNQIANIIIMIKNKYNDLKKVKEESNQRNDWKKLWSKYN